MRCRFHPKMIQYLKLSEQYDMEIGREINGKNGRMRQNQREIFGYCPKFSLLLTLRKLEQDVYTVVSTLLNRVLIISTRDKKTMGMLAYFWEYGSKMTVRKLFPVMRLLFLSLYRRVRVFEGGMAV